MTRTILAAAFAACTVLAAGAASAQTAPTVSSRSIAYGDLDLSTVDGARVFQTRVDAAARSFCAENIHLAGRTTCERAIREEAVSKLPSAARVSYAQARSSVEA